MPIVFGMTLLFEPVSFNDYCIWDNIYAYITNTVNLGVYVPIIFRTTFYIIKYKGLIILEVVKIQREIVWTILRIFG